MAIIAAIEHPARRIAAAGGERDAELLGQPLGFDEGRLLLGGKPAVHRKLGARHAAAKVHQPLHVDFVDAQARRDAHDGG